MTQSHGGTVSTRRPQTSDLSVTGPGCVGLSGGVPCFGLQR